MKRAAIFDLDGTLCDVGHRLHHVRDGARNWDAFFAGIPDDSIVEPISDILSALNNAGANIVLCSGRPERCREMTVKWLANYYIPYAALYMRPDNDTRPDHVIKAQMLEAIRTDGYDPFIVIDDRQSVVDMWREKGLVCLQAAASDPEIPKTAMLTLMVGPSGGGKTTWVWTAEAHFGIIPSQVISADVTRAEFCGDFRDQSRNQAVFSAVHAIAKARLKHGLHAVIDATHLRRRDRMAAAALANGACPVRYVVVNRPMDEKIRDAGWRAEVKKNGEPFDLIAAHEQTFNSQLKEILAGDGLPNVEVIDLRGE